MEQAGMRWSKAGAQAMLDLRSVRLSGDWMRIGSFIGSTNMSVSMGRCISYPQVLRSKPSNWRHKNAVQAFHAMWSHSNELLQSVAHKEEIMSSKQIFSIGTSVFYQGDDTNNEGYDKITNHLDDYLGELQFEVTLEDGRILYDVTPADFEAQTVLGNTKAPEFQMVDG
jgi:hypothetical protein